MNKCAAKNVTCNFCRKLWNFEQLCRAKKNSRGRSSVGMIQGQDGQEQFESEEMKDDQLQHGSSAGWFNKLQEKCVRSWDSDSSG